MDISNYTNLVTSEHQKPNFLAVLSAVIQPLVDNINLVENMSSYFDIDTAVSVQLDTVGLWIGISRYLSIPLVGVYFSLDIAGLGLDQGSLLGQFDNPNGLTTLPDDAYRTLLKAKIANNQWDGTIPMAYALMNLLFPNNTFIIQDNGDMTMLIGVIGSSPLDAVHYSLLVNSYLDIDPAGVTIAGHITPSVWGSPLFGLDLENSSISGLDVGAIAIIV